MLEKSELDSWVDNMQLEDLRDLRLEREESM